MPLTILFGVNGSGKDTLAKCVKNKFPNLEILSGSRIMMKGMGLPVEINSDFQVPKHFYDELERLPTKTKAHMADTVFKHVLQDFNAAGRFGVLSSHLVIARREDGIISYETDLIREWFPEIFNSFVFVRASPSEIYERSNKDKNIGERDRGLFTLESINTQQKLSTEAWSKLSILLTGSKERMLSVYNLDGGLGNSTEILSDFINVSLYGEQSENRPSYNNELRSLN